ncbi:unnamed protein product [Callosobruchus maculatus]|uniref:Uncharacterized protein n=1 Tax=Callosobruchus maculatus TaxID=64391 RepID=A0A653C0G0_CALMS|nr:unnamed protein product [Callosobruchus maculatus]
MAVMLKVGDRFSSFADAKKRLRTLAKIRTLHFGNEMYVLRTLPEDISHAVLDEAVDIYVIRGFCTDKAFEKIVNVVEQKRFRQRWT